MAFEFLGIDLNKLSQISGSKELATHESAISNQNTRDVREALLEMAKSMRETKDLAQKQLDSQQKEVIESQQKFVASNFRDVLEEYFGEKGISSAQARKFAGAITERVQTDEVQNLGKTIDTVTNSFKNLDRNIFDFTRNLISGGSGAAAAAGFIHGQPMAVLGGALGLGSNLFSNYQRIRLEQQLKPESQRSSVLLESVKASIPEIAKFAVGAAMTVATEAFRVAPDRIHRAYEFQGTFEQARYRGFQGTPQEMIRQSGIISGQRILDVSQMQQFVQQFVQTGGGTNEQFNRSMDTFTRNLLIFGESANIMLQASRRLQMWIPDKEFDTIIQKYTDQLTKSGIPPELIQQQIQLLSSQSERIGQMNFRDPEKAVNNLLANSEFISTKLGLPGQIGSTAMEGVNQFVKGSINNPSQFAFLQAAGLSTQEILRITSGQMKISDLEPSKLQGIMTSFRQRTGSLGEDVSAVLATQMFGEEGSRLFEAQAYGRVGPKRRAVEVPTAEEVVQRREGLQITESRFRQLGADQFISGFSTSMQDTARTVAKFEQVGEGMIQGMSKLIGSIEALNRILSTKTATEQFNPPKIEEPLSMPRKPASGSVNMGISSVQLQY